jgi:hypothetical protein
MGSCSSPTSLWTRRNRFTWFLTFFRYHKEDLGLSPTSLDQCLLYKRDQNQELQALVSVQADDILAVGDAAYFALEEERFLVFSTNQPKHFADVLLLYSMEQLSIKTTADSS